MTLNKVGIPIFSSKDLIKEIYKGNIDYISQALVDPNDIDYMSYIEFVEDNKLKDWPIPEPYFSEGRSIQDFDNHMQDKWYIPEEYKHFDVKNYILNLCSNNIEEKRVLKELELFEKYNMIPLLTFLKYLVDSMRENNVLWGVGRGSSVASFCLYLLGVHKIDSIKYELDITEFLR